MILACELRTAMNCDRVISAVISNSTRKVFENPDHIKGHKEMLLTCQFSVGCQKGHAMHSRCLAKQTGGGCWVRGGGYCCYNKKDDSPLDFHHRGCV